MREARLDNAIAALDIFQNVIRSDSLSGDQAAWTKAFDAAQARAAAAAKPAPASRGDAAFSSNALRMQIQTLSKDIEDLQRGGGKQSEVRRLEEKLRELKAQYGEASRQERDRGDGLSSDVAKWRESYDKAKAGQAAKPGAVKADAVEAIYIVRYLDDRKTEHAAKVRAISEDDAERKVRRHAGVLWGDIVDVKKADSRSDAGAKSSKEYNAEGNRLTRLAQKLKERGDAKEADRTMAAAREQYKLASAGRSDATPSGQTLIAALSRRELFRAAENAGIDYDTLSDEQVRERLLRLIGNNPAAASHHLKNLL